METNETKKMNITEMLQLGLLILLPIALFAAFSSDGITDNGYKELLNSMSFLMALGSVDYAKIIGLLFIIISTVLNYLALSKLTDNKNIAFLVCLLFVFAPMVSTSISYFSSFTVLASVLLFSISLSIIAFAKDNIRYLSILPALIGLFLVFQNLNIGAISPSSIISIANSLGMILPLSFLSLLSKDIKRKELLAPLIIAVLAVPLFPSLSLVALSVYAAFGIKRMGEEHNDTNVLIAFGFFIVLFLSTEMPAAMLSFTIVAFGFAILLYFILSLRIMSLKTLGVFSIFFIIALASSMAIVKLENAAPAVPSKETIEMFKSAKDIDGAFAVLELPNAFRFYSSKDANTLSREELLGKQQINADYIFISSDGLYRMFDNRSVALRFLGIDETSPQGYNALFGNKAYLLYAKLSSEQNYGILGEPQPVMFDYKSGYKTTIPFTKLRSFSSTLTVLHKDNILINTAALNDGALYEILVKCKVISENNTTKIIQVC